MTPTDSDPQPTRGLVTRDPRPLQVHRVTTLDQPTSWRALVRVSGPAAPPRRRGWGRMLPLLAAPAAALLRLVEPFLVAAVWLVGLPAALLIVTGHAGVIGLADEVGPTPWLVIAVPVALMVGFLAFVAAWTASPRRRAATASTGHACVVVHARSVAPVQSKPVAAIEARPVPSSDHAVDDLAVQLLGIHLFTTGEPEEQR